MDLMTVNTNLQVCHYCGIEIPPGYGCETNAEKGIACAVCHYRLDPTLAARSPYLEGKICSVCGKLGSSVAHDLWDLAPDPTDLTSPRSRMRLLCKECLGWIIGVRIESEGGQLVGTLMFSEQYFVSIGGEVTFERYPILAPKFGVPSHMSFDKWVGSRVYISLTNNVEGGITTAVLVRPIVP